ncbi:MAG TPA: efflux RND transporter periplasmic adaptor subunit [Bryobacteraceae bacterium]|jgi:RND family efflux transporter MFP subunit|nr:efflux RND transporter periplasmic adaptor subunit [Bryobacteraceae bacterium]
MLDREPIVVLPPTRPPSKARTLHVVLLLLVAVVIVAGVVFFGINARIQTAAAVKETTRELAIPAVAIIHPKPGAVKNEVVLPGNIQAFTDAPIYARSSGYLKQWNVDIGGHVKAGQVLATIEAPELDQQVRQAKASIQQTQASLDQAIANEAQGKANEELARVTAQRWQNLVAKGAVSRQENDQYQAQYQAQVANLNALEQAIAAARSNIAVAEANLGRLQEMQAYEIVKAPFDGIVTARNIDVGALINAGNGGPAQELFHLAATDKLRVYVNVPQADSRAAAPGLKSYLTLAEFPGRKFQGELVRTAGAIDAATRTLLTEVDVDNTSGELRPGAYAEVHLMIPEGSRSLILPVNTLIFRSEGLRVGVVRNGNRADLVPVILGKDFGNEVEVVSGIDENDLVIANPPDSLSSGAAVQVVQSSDVH